MSVDTVPLMSDPVRQPSQIAHHGIPTVPIRLELEMRLDFLRYKPRRCATMLMLLCMSSSYPTRGCVSSGRTRTLSSRSVPSPSLQTPNRQQVAPFN
jgi:hypothetical protein